ncbi:hypothetical protein MLD38_034635 [Melastoma candidum]|uniref:Uncharacterized protein n=1 Tax=Melastoma candidum TaxID=119954 RepID=A0ACB9MEJ6_9MYRT|nr:hypothetical protein MLD38_034635 [Melastoma candidum]
MARLSGGSLLPLSVVAAASRRAEARCDRRFSSGRGLIRRVLRRAEKSVACSLLLGRVSGIEDKGEEEEVLKSGDVVACQEGEDGAPGLDIEGGAAGMVGHQRSVTRGERDSSAGIGPVGRQTVRSGSASSPKLLSRRRLTGIGKGGL